MGLESASDSRSRERRASGAAAKRKAGAPIGARRGAREQGNISWIAKLALAVSAKPADLIAGSAEEGGKGGGTGQGEEEEEEEEQ
mmetsp:Transcript_84376/g.234992  ORF Transcript_84376/g.234992 Transcript_84376/m.234992 type:complete len:85 (-) Transcript_84376:49-303(-)